MTTPRTISIGTIGSLRTVIDQGLDQCRLPRRLRIRRLGVRVPSGAQQIKAVTSANVGHGLLRVPQLSPTFPSAGTVVLRWCSAVSERSVPAGADQCFCSPPALDLGLDRVVFRPLWIRDVDLHSPVGYPAGPVATCGSLRCWKRAGATAGAGTVAPATHLTSVCRRPPDADSHVRTDQAPSRHGALPQLGSPSGCADTPSWPMCG